MSVANATAQNVTDHGALCDGVTDDAVAIQAAVDTVGAAGGGMVSFPAGVCLTGATIEVGATQPAVYLRGEGPGTSVLRWAPGDYSATGAQPLIRFGAVTQGGVSALTLSGNPGQATGASLFGVELSGANEIRIEGVEFADLPGAGVSAAGSSGVSIRASRFHGLGGPGVSVTGSWSGIAVRGSFFHDNGAHEGLSVVLGAVDQATGLSVTGNTIRSGPNRALRVSDGSLVDSVFSSNVVEGRVEISSAHSSAFLGNRVRYEGAGTESAVALASSTDFILADNVIGSPAAGGVTADGNTGLTVTSNRVEAGTVGLRATDTSRLQVRNNTFFSTASPSVDDGIEILTSAGVVTDVQVLNNQVHEFLTGIRLDPEGFDIDLAMVADNIIGSGVAGARSVWEEDRSVNGTAVINSSYETNLADPNLETNIGMDDAEPGGRVTDHGALCDGVTDDAVAIQAAVDTVGAAGGGMVSFPAGVCLTGATIEVGATQPAVYLRGEGPGTSVLRWAPGDYSATGAQPLIRFGAVTQGGVSALTLSGNPGQATGASLFGVELSGANEIRIEGVEFADLPGAGVSVAGSSGVSVASSHFHGLGGPGVSMAGSWSGIAVRDSFFHDNGAHEGLSVVLGAADQATGLSVTGNTIRSGLNRAFLISGGGSLVDSVFSSNVVEGRVEISSAHSSAFLGNRVRYDGAGTESAVALASSTDFILADNVIGSPAAGGVTADGITSLAVTSNRVEVGTVGLRATDTSRLQVRNNTFVSMASPSVDDGIEILTSAGVVTDVQVLNNQVHEFLTGIRLDPEGFDIDLAMVADNIIGSGVAGARSVWEEDRSANGTAVINSSYETNLADPNLDTNIGVDLMPPALAITAPTDPILYNDITPTIIVEYSDDANGDGVDVGTLQVMVGSLAASCTAGPVSATCISPSLAAGAHTISASTRDLAGNEAIATKNFELVVDTAAPALAITSPTAAVIFNEAAPVITLNYSDAPAGMDLGTLSVSVDAQDVTANCTVSASSASCPSPILAAGSHVISTSVRDLAGNEATASHTFELILDTAAPALAILSPNAGTIFNETQPVITLEYSDAPAGIALATLSVSVDGQDVTASCTVGASSAGCPSPVLAAGSHVISSSIRDLAGNEATATRNFDLVIDSDPPAVAILSPINQEYSSGSVPQIVGQFSDAGAGIDSDSVRVLVDSSIIAGCTVDASSVTCSPPALNDGPHTVRIEASDAVGNPGAAEVSFQVVSDQLTPTIEVVQPAAGALLFGGEISIILELSDDGEVDPDSLVVLLDGTDVSDTCVATATDATCTPAPVAAGSHTLEIEVADTSGNVATASLVFNVILDLDVEITSPETGDLTRDDTVSVSGTVSLEAESVEVAGVLASLANGSFTAVGVPLVEGSNELMAVARSSGGAVGSGIVTVIRDTTAPRIVFSTPLDGSVTTAPQIVVAGDIVDLTSSAAERKEVTVLVNGREAQVENRSFVVENFLLQPGLNTIVAECADAAGNLGRAEVTVELLTTPTHKLEELMGNMQAALVTTTLPNPLMVRMTDAIGNPVFGRDVTFAVTRGNGLVMDFPVAARELTVRTDEQGRARVQFALGDRAGAGNHEVTATATGFPGSVVFCASAVPDVADRIVPIQGERQTGAVMGAAGEPLPNPIYAQVFDQLGNPIAGASVSFDISRGGGSVGEGPGGASSYSVLTDEEGKAMAVWTLGPSLGINSQEILATVSGLVGQAAYFIASTEQTGAEAATSFSGRVVDGQDDPVPGVTLHISGTTLETVSDAEGRFKFPQVPVGALHLEVDGTTTTRSGEWPKLAFEFVTLAGAANDLGMPVRMLELDVPNAKIVGGSEDVVLQMADVPGAELLVYANSATFPDGSTTGLLSFTQVHTDKVPMVAPRGSTFQVVAAIQPAGVKFDPPAQLSIPNMGAPPGTTVEMYSFDHDLGEFLSIGPASVTADGERLVTRPGFGVVKSGWHGGPPNVPTNDACGAGPCYTCANGRRVSRCGGCETCGEGGCEPRFIVDEDEIQFFAFDREEDGKIFVGRNQYVNFTVNLWDEVCSDAQYDYDFGDGSTTTTIFPVEAHRYATSGEKTVEVTIRCNSQCPQQQSRSVSIVIVVDPEADLEIRGLPEEDQPTPNEVDPGAFITVNNDDDDDDGVEDWMQTGPVPGENDLVEMKITLGAEFENFDRGVIGLSLIEGAGKIRIWETATKDAEIELPKTWDLETERPPETVWVEGVTSSSAVRDIKLALFLYDRVEFVSDGVVFTVVDVDFSALPDTDSFIEAAAGPTTLVSSVFYRDFEDSSEQRTVEDGAEIEWELLQGSGSLESLTTTTNTGLATVGLDDSNQPGDLYRVKATVNRFKIAGEDTEIETSLSAETGVLEVIPGDPASIAVTQSVTAYQSDGAARVTFEAVVQDVVGNSVADGTSVSWTLGESTSDFVSFQSATVNGRATAELVAPVVPRDQVVFVRSGGASASVTMSVSRVTGSIVSTQPVLDLSAGDTAVLTALVQAADGSEIYWHTSNGVLSGATPVAGGQSTVTLSAAGGYLGPVVVTATVGDRLMFWQGEFVQPGALSVTAESLFLVADDTQNGTEQVVWPDGTSRQIPYYGSSLVDIEGPPNAVVSLAPAGVVLTEAYTFDTIAGNVVPGLVAGNDLVLSGGGLDANETHNGQASLLLGATDFGTIADSVALDFSTELSLTLWVRPDSLQASTLVEKAGAWALEMLSDGRVRASVSTSNGTYEVTGTSPLVAGEWNRVGLHFQPSLLRVHVNADTALTTVGGALDINTADILVGSGFSGHLDDLSFHAAVGVFEFIQIEGCNAVGEVKIGPDGKVTITMRSAGGGTEDVLIADIGFIYDGVETVKTFFLFRKDTWVKVWDAVDAFFGADPEGTVDVVTSMAGGFLIVGDVGVLGKNLYRTYGNSETEVNTAEYLLAGLGLLTTLNPVADAVVASARTVVAFIGKSPLGDLIWRLVKHTVLSAEPVDGSRGLLAFFAANLDHAQAFKNVLSKDSFDDIVRVFDKMGDSAMIGLKQIADNPQLGAQAAEDVVEALGDLSDEALDLLNAAPNPAAAVQKLGKVAQHVDARRITDMLDNCVAAPTICSPSYTVQKLIDDLEVVAEIDGFAKLTGGLINPVQNFAEGFRYELEVAAHFVRMGKNVSAVSLDVFEGSVKATDIDIVVDDVFFQNKKGNFGTSAQIENWVGKAIKEAGGDASKVRYLTPNPAGVDEEIRELLVELGVNIHPEGIPFS